MAFGEILSGRSLPLQKRLRFIEKLVAILGPARDFDAHQRKQLGTHRRTARSVAKVTVPPLDSARWISASVMAAHLPQRYSNNGMFDLSDSVTAQDLTLVRLVKKRALCQLGGSQVDNLFLQRIAYSGSVSD